jgi:arylsulfatase A-like enzyme
MYRALFLDTPGREPPAGRAAALAYDQEARYADDHVGPFLATLARLHLNENTIVVLTSDHGEEFGEHGGMGHGRTLYREVLRVPLVIAAPGLLTPATVTTPATLLDVVPTLSELLRLPVDVHDRGVSLTANARQAAAGSSIDPDTAARPLFAEVDRVDRTRVQMVAVRRSGATAIADLTTNTINCYGPDDPEEQHPQGSSCPELAELIELHRQASRPIGTTEPAKPADPELIEKMRALGYIQ